MNRDTPHGTASVSQLCALFDVSRSGFYAARAPRPAAAVAPTVPTPTRGRRPVVSSADALAAIREVVDQEAAWGVRKVWATLRRRGMAIGRRRVWALMQAAGLVFRRDREPGDPPRGHVTVPEANRRFATDLTTTRLRSGQVVAIVLALDCGCRSVLGANVSIDQDAPTVLAPVREALEAAFGSPEHVPEGLELRTDHGPQYTGADCRDLAEEWGLEHTFAPVGRPTGNAVVERVIRTLKEEVIWLRDWDTVEEVAAAVEAWRHRYNHDRPHQALAWRTPAEQRRLLLRVPELAPRQEAA